MSHTTKRKLIDGLFRIFVSLALVISMLFLISLLFTLIKTGIKAIDFGFLFGRLRPSDPEHTGIVTGIAGTFLLALLVFILTIPIGIGSAIFIEEYVNRKTRFYKIIDITISNLSGVPSVIYGILGATLFVGALRGTAIAGGVTLSLLILPVVIVSSQEALKSVPGSLKEAAYGLGMTKWQMIKAVVFPYAMPGIITGFILAISRAVGEAAPLIVVGIATSVTFTPTGIFDTVTALPLLINSFTSLPGGGESVAAAVSLVLLFFILVMNGVATTIRYKFSKRK